MEEIIYRQQDAAGALSGKAFTLAAAGVILRLAIAQIIVNLFITLTGTGLINIVFYLYAVWLLLGIMQRTVAAYVYTLRSGMLILEKKLGESTVSLVEAPLARVVSLRPAYMAERLRTSYRQVNVVDPAARPTARVRAAFVISLFSARLARKLAGRRAQEQIGYVIVFVEDGRRRACVFRPDETLLSELKKQLGDAFGFDERMTQAKVHTLYARALERAFPSLYAYVDPLVKPGDVEWAKEEIERQKAEGKKAREVRNNGKSGGAAKSKAGKIENSGQTEAQNAQTGAKRRRRAKQE